MRILAIITVALAVASGCGPAGPETYNVAGTVTYEGQPLEEGAIGLIPADPKVRGTEVPIEGGHYAMEVPAGEMEVRIFATRPSGPTEEGMPGPPMEQYLHQNYNTRSKLRLTVRPEGENVYDFELNRQGT